MNFDATYRTYMTTCIKRETSVTCPTFLQASGAGSIFLLFVNSAAK